jgi:multiple sugar transport system ATP-binding protein
MASVTLQNVNKKFGNTEVIRNLSLAVDDGEFVTLVGPSGCGKTTTLRMIAGLEEITSGELYIGNVLSNDIPPKKRGISMVFQSYALFPHMTVAENIAFGLKIKGYARNDIFKRIEWAAGLLGLHGMESRLPRDLSGGQRQRVAFARALVLEPKVLLLDEPLSNLDAKLRLKMRSELKRIHKKLRSTILYVTHDQVEAMSLSDRIAVMDQGNISQSGAPLDVYNSPANIFVAGFIGSPAMNFINGRIIKNENGIYVDFGSFQLALPETCWGKCADYTGKDVIFGIRPEDIHDKRFVQPENINENTIDVVIDVVEPLGEKDIAEAVKGEVNFTLLEKPAAAGPDMRIDVLFNMNKSHLFDEQTGKNLFYT